MIIVIKCWNGPNNIQPNLPPLTQYKVFRNIWILVTAVLELNGNYKISRIKVLHLFSIGFYQGS